MTKKIIMTMIVYVGFISIDFILDKNLSTNAMVSKDSESLIAAPATTKAPILPVPIINGDIVYRDVKATVYHAIAGQTDATPFITADNSFIDTSRVNDLRWVAVSRDLLKLKTSKYNFTGKLRLGDTIWVSYDKSEIYAAAKRRKLDPKKLISKYEKVVGWWVVKDTMGDYFWEAQVTDSAMIDSVKVNPGRYKIKNGIVYKKVLQRNWIDFLQHPKTGMLHHWNKSLIITKKKVVRHKPILKKG